MTATKPRPGGAHRDPLAPFSRPVREWFEASFEAPTEAQARGWAAIAAAQHTLIHAPTGSGKTLAAFLWALDRLATHPSPRTHPRPARPVRVLYVSPLKALTYDVERNLRAPLTGIAQQSQRLGEPAPTITVASRTGDTPAEDRRELARRPPDILITTPESLYLMLTSAAREILRGVEHVIVDEVHAIAGTKRGAHLALSLERLEALAGAGRAAPCSASGCPPRNGRSTRSPVSSAAWARAARSRSSTPARASRSISRSSSRSTTCRRSARSCRSTSSPAARRRRRERPQQHLAGDPPADPRAHPEPPQHDRLHEQPAAERAARAAAQRARRRGPGPGPSREHRPRAAAGDRGGPQGRAAPRAGRHVQPRARHRHGRGRPRHPGREPDQRRPRAPARRPSRPPGRGTEQGRHLPEVPRRPARMRRRHASDARGRDRGHVDPAQPARRPRPAARRDDGHGPLDGRRPAGHGHPRVAVRDADPRPARGRPRRCSPAPTRRTSSPSSSRGSSGTG